MPKKPGPSLAPPIDTNGGISSSGTLLFHLVGDDRAVARVLDARVRHEARVHVIAAAVVIGLARAHRAHDRQVLHLLRQLRHQLANLEVAGGGDRLELARRRRARLHVPHIDRRRPAAQPQQDRRLVIPAQRLGIRPQRPRKRKRRQRKRRRPRQVTHEMPTRHAVRNVAAVTCENSDSYQLLAVSY